MIDSLSKAVDDVSRGITPVKLTDPSTDFTGTRAFTYLDGDGMLISHTAEQVTRVHHKRFPHLERQRIPVMKAIVVHQTDSATSRSVFANYSNPNTNVGAHFLIDKDGTIYQTGSIHYRMNHIGNILRRCVGKFKCGKPRGVSPSRIHAEEMKKPESEHFPSNDDSIGIELVGDCVDIDKKDPKKGCHYETVTNKQNEALDWLIKQLAFLNNQLITAVWRHPEIAAKHPEEALTAKIPPRTNAY